MSEREAQVVRNAVLSITADEDAVQEALLAAWQVLRSGGSLPVACRAGRAAAARHLAAERRRCRREAALGLLF